MVLLGEGSALARHRGPSRLKLLTAGAMAAALFVAGSTLVIARYDDRPPGADRIAYEGGYLTGTRVRQRDVRGDLVPELLAGGCARMAREGLGGGRAALDPDRWVAGCLDGAAGHPSWHQGLLGY
ncbi:hypothetical protein I3F58_12715 [Streptomyces sp. MUM 203J]|uniref:hypothetical protein n=1 Tax=Streptomyces sp. MUM 203J TaxID=2791990 RepID=UPI001F04913A|nr:hypothetical protein [Streptomyces sp. MUM 203J]MCH0540417.1 hypothetical protein [Streptomyces sp. MUM 203J]